MFNSHFSRILARSAFLASVILTILVSATSAHAAGPTGSVDAANLGDVFCNFVINAKPFATFFQYAAYVSGAICGVQGIYHFRLHTENPGNNPLTRPIMLWFGAMCLLCLPEVIGSIIKSLYGTAGTGGSTACDATPPTQGAGTPDVIITNLFLNIKAPLVLMASVIAVVCGVFMIVHGFMKASKYGFDPKANSINSILANIVFGTLLITIGDNLTMVMTSVFGTSTVATSNVIDWTFLDNLAGGASSAFQSAVEAALGFVQVIGAIAFVRGWLIMKKVSEGGGQVTMAQGITHILGGAFAINIYAVLKIFDNTLGTGLI